MKRSYHSRGPWRKPGPMATRVSIPVNKAPKSVGQSQGWEAMGSNLAQGVPFSSCVMFTEGL